MAICTIMLFQDNPLCDILLSLIIIMSVRALLSYLFQLTWSNFHLPVRLNSWLLSETMLVLPILSNTHAVYLHVYAPPPFFSAAADRS